MLYPFTNIIVQRSRAIRCLCFVYFIDHFPSIGRYTTYLFENPDLIEQITTYVHLAF